MIQAKIIADSKNEFGNRITTMMVTFPRFILAEWHIPFGDTLQLNSTSDSSAIEVLSKQVNKTSMAYAEYIEALAIKIATARCARVSYTVVGDEDKPVNYANDIKLHDRLAESGHWSPFEHCAQAMGNTNENLREDWGVITRITNKEGAYGHATQYGWCGNFRGFIQYRKLFENENVQETCKPV